MGALRGLMDPRWPMAVTLIGRWLIALPADWAPGLPVGLGAAAAVWSGYTLGIVLAAIILSWRFWRRTRTA